MNRYAIKNVSGDGTEKFYQAYRYRAADLSPLWLSSVPRSQQSAVDYIDKIAWFYKHTGGTPEFLEGRTAEGDYEPIKWEIEDEHGTRRAFVPSLLSGSGYA